LPPLQSKSDSQGRFFICPSYPFIRTRPNELVRRALFGGDITGIHKLEDIGTGFVPAITSQDLADEIVAVKDEEAMSIARQLAREEGI